MKKIFGIFFILLATVLLVGCKDNSSKVKATIIDLTVEVKTMSFTLQIEDPENEITGNISIRLVNTTSGADVSTRTTTKEALVDQKQTFDYVNLTPSNDYTITISAVIGRKSVFLKSEPFTTKPEDSIITTVAQFLAIANNRTGNYELANDLDFTGVEFTPLFLTASNGFSGSFDGKGFELRNITFKSIDSYTGLFGNVTSGRIANVTLRNVNIGTESTPLSINKASRIGLLSGYLSSSAAEVRNIHIIDSNIYVTSSSTINLYVGGLVGENVLGRIEDIKMENVNVDVTSTSTGNVKVGGVVGFMSDTSSFSRPKLINIESHTNVSFTLANTRVVDKSLSFVIGGIIGDNNAQFVNYSAENLFNSGNVSIDLDFGTQSGASSISYTVNVGGLIGRTYSNIKSGIFAGSIHVSHEANEHEANISKTFNVGGLIGTYIVENSQRTSDELLRLGDNQSIDINLIGDALLRVSHTIASKNAASVVTVHHFGELITMVNDESRADQDGSIVLPSLEDYFTSTWLEQVYQNFSN